MADYQGNSKKAKAESMPEDKKIERVVVGEVIIQKPSVGRRFKGIFMEADLKTVARYVTMDILIPAAKTTIVESVRGGIDRLVFGDSAVRRRNINSGPRIQYHNNPTSLGVPYQPSGGILGRLAPSVSPEPRQQTQKMPEDVIILSSREEADLVLERMQDVIDKYQVISLHDFKGLIGAEQHHVDFKWGWTFLGSAHIRQVRDGWLLDLPPVEVI